MTKIDKIQLWIGFVWIIMKFLQGSKAKMK